MMLAGLPVRDADVLELARLLRDAGFDATAEWLEAAYDREATIVAVRSPSESRSSERSTIRRTVWPSCGACCSTSTRGVCDRGWCSRDRR